MPDVNRPPAPLEATAPHTPMVFLCPSCESALEYAGTRTIPRGELPADVNDYFRCPIGCGTFEHERRTHRMRLSEAAPENGKA